MFNQGLYPWAFMLRSVSAGSFLVVLIAFQIGSRVPFGLEGLVAIFGGIWMLSLPAVVMLHFMNFQPNLSLFWAKNRELSTLPIVLGVAGSMDTANPRKVKIIETDKLNAATNGNILYITRGLLPYLWTNFGRAVLAHEFAHMKLRHTPKLLVLMLGVFILSLQFGAHFSVAGDFFAFAMTVLAFFTLFTFLIPPISREMEYEADALATKEVGQAAMIGMFNAIAPPESQARESDSHPSFRSRIDRIRRGG